MNRVSRSLTLSMGLLWTGVAAGAEKKILFLAGSDSHGWGTHQHFGGTVILSNGMKHAGLPVEVQVVREWPGAAVLKDQDALVIYADGWGAHPANGHLDELKEFMDGGGGLTVIHWATGVGNPGMGDKSKDHSPDPVRRQWRNLVGADFEPWHSVSRFWDASFEKLPKHAVTRGVPPFVIHDECYFHLRCIDPEHKHVTPMHGVVPPLNIIEPGRRMDSGSKSAVDAVKSGEEQYCAWGFERPDGGRAFGFTGGHTHWNWGRDELRKLILNGIYWTAGGEVPSTGVHSQRPSAEEMLEHLKGNPGWEAEALQIALNRAGDGELIKWGRYRGGPLPFGKPKPKPGGGGVGIVHEGEKLKVLKSSGMPRPQIMTEFGAEVWSANSQLWWTDAKPGDVLEFEIPGMKAGEYEVHLAGTRAVDYGIHSFSVNGAKLGKVVDFFQPAGVSHTGDLNLGVAPFKAGANRFTVKVAGAHPKSVKRYMFGMDYLRLIKVEGKESLFDGKSLEGWDGNKKWWRVENGSLVGEIPAGQSLGHNEFLWWKDELHDFELRITCRIGGDKSANSGVQIRSQRRSDGHAAGYQADFDDGAVWFGRIYDEHGRGLLVERGTKVVIDEGGQRVVTAFRKADEYRAIVKKGEWNEYVIRALGPRIQTWINGVLASELIDNQLGQHDYSGRIAIQLHSGPGPARVEYKKLEVLDLGKTDPPQPLAGGAGKREGIVPEGKNLGFEEGTLRGWKVEGDVWKGGPIKGDTVTPRRPGQASNHDGDFWVGGYERTKSDEGQGVLASDPFKVTHPWGSFLVGGGPDSKTRVEVVAVDGGKVIFTAKGKQTENMRVVPVDLRKFVGSSIRVRVVDESAGPWGHINYDDFRFHAAKPGAVVQSPSRKNANPLLSHLIPNPGEHENQTVAGMLVPEGFRVDLIAQEPELTQPIAFTFDERGRLWVVEAHSYPRRQPEGKGKDRIVIFEDADANGTFETRKIFAKGLNLVSGIEVGFGGVWVGAAPQFLFIPDKNRDDVPDGEAVVLLDGWGLQDTHETLNSFTWGPDGWLYGNEGVFCHSLIGKPGTPESRRTEMRAGVWRYHPTRHQFEVFARGCSNQWGIDFNERGHMFLTHCRSAWGGGPTTYVVKNGHYWNQSNSRHAPFVAAGQAGWNPGGEKAFRNFLPSSARYGHGEGGAGKAGSRALYGGHSHVGTMIYLGGNWPEKYRDQLFTHNLHGRQMNRQINQRHGSGYETVHAGYDQLYVADTRFMGVELKYGPDGAVYMIDWQDQQHCHNTREEIWDRSDGGIYRMAWTETYEPRAVDLHKSKTSELVAMQFHRNEWFVRTARRVLQERGDRAAIPLLEMALRGTTDPPKVLRAMWTLHALGAKLPLSLLGHEDESVRGWAIQLMAEARTIPPTMFLQLCERDPSAMVRLALASALPGLEASVRWKAAEQLAARSEDAGDVYLPKMIWFGIAPLALDDPARIVAMAQSTELEVLADSIVWFLARDAKGRDELTTYFSKAPAPRFARQLNLLASTMPSTSRVGAPKGWAQLVVKRRSKENAAAFDRLASVFGDRKVAARMAKVLANSSAPLAERKEAFLLLAGRSDLDSSRTFVALLDDPAFRSGVIPLLGRYNDKLVAGALLGQLANLKGADRENALNALCAQPALAGAHLEQIKREGGKAKSGLTSLHLRQMRSLGDERVNNLIDGLWGRIVESGADMKASIEKFKKVVVDGKSSGPSAGKEVFAKLCAVCHVHNGVGGKLGPDLTGSWRNGVDYFLESIVDTNAVIGENFQLIIVTRNDGGVVSGMRSAETEEVLTIQTVTEVVAIQKSEIKSRQILEQSMMPVGLLDTLLKQEVVDLLKYLTTE
ncbi:MAG: PVC-type heme-binding CxxCH protein [Roseibacillus sp.]